MTRKIIIWRDVQNVRIKRWFNMRRIYKFNLSYKKRLELFRFMKELNLGIDEVRSAFYSTSIRKLRVI